MKTQKLQFVLTSLHNLQKKLKTNEKKNKKKKLSNSDNKSEQKNTNIDI